MAKGISVFTGLNYSIEDNIKFIKAAKESGFSSVFTSLHIPEADYKKSISEFKEIAALCKILNMDIIADISPRAFTYLGAAMNNLKAVCDLDIYGIRVDFGFSPKEIAGFTRNPYGLKIEINASTITERFLYEFEKFRPDYNMLQACHNYYPRLNTGISIETFKKKNKLLKECNMQVSAFIPSLVNRRGPVFEGLPTLEIHRFLEPQIAAKQLFALGADSVIFGDSIPAEEELKTVGSISEDVIDLRIETFNPCKGEENIIFCYCHENRPDPAEDAVRSQNSRAALKKDNIINPHDNIERKAGFITIDNCNYSRYCGELQICKKDLPKDDRVNVVGKVIEKEQFLIDYIEDETKFRFKRS